MTKNTKSKVGRNIPDPIRRALRQESGFGCCVCGNPFFEYHHIKEFASMQAHRLEDLMVLCPNHHHEATVGALTEAYQRAAKASPYNISRGHADGLLRIVEPGVALKVGTVDLVGPGFKFVVDGAPLLSLNRDSDGRMMLSLDVYDEQDNLLFSISENQWISGDPTPWDIQFGHRWIIVRKRKGGVLLRIDARKNPATVQGSLHRNGQRFTLERSGVRFNGAVRDVGLQHLGLVGMQLCADSSKGTFSLTPDPAFGTAMIVSWPNQAERLKRCFKALASLEAGASNSER